MSMILFIGSPITRGNRDCQRFFYPCDTNVTPNDLFSPRGLDMGPSRSYGGDSVGVGSHIWIQNKKLLSLWQKYNNKKAAITFWQCSSTRHKTREYLPFGQNFLSL